MTDRSQERAMAEQERSAQDDAALSVATDATEQDGDNGAGRSPRGKRRLYGKRIAFDAVFAALALGMFVLEMQIPLPLPVPGVKLGLSNIVSLFAMFALGPLDAFAILAVRVGLGSLFAGSVTSLLYSAAGGVASYLVALMLHWVLRERQIWVAGVLCAVVHVAAQVSVAALIASTAGVFYYLPVLAAISLVTGLATGLLAQFVYLRTRPFWAAYRSDAHCASRSSDAR